MTHQYLVLNAAKFVQTHLSDHADLHCAPNEVARERVLAAASAGLTAIEVPSAFGGAEAPFSAKLAVARILSQADFGVAMSIINTQNVAADIAQWMSVDVAARYLPGLIAGVHIGCTALTEPQAGSDFSAIKMTAQRISNGWRLNGEKIWIINAQIADLILVYAQTDTALGAKGIAGFLIDTSRTGFVRSAGSQSKNTATLMSGGFVLNDYVVHEDEMIHAPGLAFLRALESINGARLYVAGMCCGMVQECLNIATRYGLTRKTFGKALHGHQGWRWTLAEAAVDLEAAQALVQRGGQAIDLGEDAQDIAAKAKLFATRMAQKHIAALMHAMGAEGLLDIYPFSRHLYAAHIATLTDGSTEMLLERVSKNIEKQLM